MVFFIVFKPLQENLRSRFPLEKNFGLDLWASLNTCMYCNCKGKMCSTNSEIWKLVSYYEDAVQRRKSLESTEDEVRAIF